MVQPQQVQQRRVQIVERDRLLHRLEAELVGRSNHLTAFDAGAGHQHGLRAGVVIAPDPALRDRHAPELRVHDDQRPVQQTARLEVGQQACHRPIRFGGVLRVIPLDVVVRVPGVGVLVADAAGKDLHEPDAALDEPSRHQALAPERLAHGVVEAVERLRRLGLTRDVHRLRRASLHAIGELVRGDARRQLAVAGEHLHVQFVQLRQRVEPGTLGIGAQACRRLQVDDRIAGRTKLRPLIGSRNESGAPIVRPAERPAARIGHHDVGGKTGCDRSQSIGDPRTHTRESQVDLAGLHFVGALHVIVRPPVDRA